jgi:hypothetical protein
MKTLVEWIAALLLAMTPSPAALGQTAAEWAGAKFGFQKTPGQLHITVDGRELATYLVDHPKLTRRALVNVRTPGGIQVTRNFPPRAPEDLDPGYRHENGIIHPLMHPGLWMGFGDVDGNDYWRLKARVEHVAFVEEPTGGAGRGSFAVHNRYLSEDGRRIVCTELARYVFLLRPYGVLLLWESEFAGLGRSFYFGDQEESGLAVRVASPLRVAGGNGSILNDRGQRDGAQTWGKQANWIDYFGTIGDRQVGVMLMPDPENPRRCWMHSRDYGVVVVNPFPRQPHERREPYVKTTVAPGQAYRLGYGVAIHDMAADEPFDRQAVYADYLKLKSNVSPSQEASP